MNLKSHPVCIRYLPHQANLGGTLNRARLILNKTLSRKYFIPYMKLINYQISCVVHPHPFSKLITNSLIM